ncbi:arsenate reductase (glutaredoxin) [Undibacterium piscinae]|uniref:Arsenate reductase n=1 Tax=Undibacterium piscinae TaxID=2495591 RepID=A0A6M4A6A6_9BURK|nr:arsenate reductase (glutaredoxin) [Undibacterium piscinae]
MITIYHNPRCSKSRETLALLEQLSSEKNLPLEVVDYQKSALDTEQLRQLHLQLGGQLRSMLRDNESEYAELNLSQADDETLLAAVASHPRLLQRPIVSYQGKAAIGRPPELVLSLFEENTKVTL